ncbi:MAG: lytic transglycosylase domain-containing protein [Rudanella sp.]|nr:lytic transglycosylase domain-containing protein [Rudanella sp.]
MKHFLVLLMVALTSLRSSCAVTNGATNAGKLLDDELAAWANLPPVFFCGEAVPVHEEAVARRLVSALVQKSSYNQALYEIRQRAASFFPLIEPIMERYKIPADFKYLPLVESSLRGNAVSRSGAVGYWQLMPATARELGLTVDNQNDERQHLLKSTDAACRYLRFLYVRLGSWTLAAAAYNNGIGNLLSSIKRQHESDYYYLHLNAETGKYLYRIIAFKELFDNYVSYRPVLPLDVWKTLSEPLKNIKPAILDEEKPLLAESMIIAETQLAANQPVLANPATAKRQQETPLPNAADVFRGGIKARLAKAGVLKRGQVWVFQLTRDGMADGKTVDQGDVLYAIVEDIDPKLNKVFLRGDKLYSKENRETYNMTLSAVDASTGRIGISLPDMEQVKAGWISTWKVL